MFISLEDETDPHIKDLLFAAKRYAALIQTDGNNFEAVYNHGLVLQGLAAKFRMRISGGNRDGELKQVWQLLRQVVHTRKAGFAVKYATKLQCFIYSIAIC